MLKGMLKQNTNTNQVCQFASPLNNIGANMAAKAHMGSAIKPMIWATQLTAKLICLFCFSFITGCAMVVGMGNQVDEDDVSTHYQTLPELSANEQEALLIIVHEYFVRCCGASADVELTGQHESGGMYQGELDALDDFICWRLPTGGFEWQIRVGDQVFPLEKMVLNSGQTYYYKVASDLRRPAPYKVSVEPISEKLAYHHIHKTLERVREYNVTGPSPDVIARIKAKGPERVAKKLECQ